MVTAVLIFDPSTPSSPASMRASGLVLISPDRTQAGQEFHSCVVAILASKLHWEPSKQTIAGMELKYAFRKLGITDDSVLMDFSEPLFYRLFLPLDEESLNKCVDEDTELLETSFNPYTIVLISKIAKVLAVAAKESTYLPSLSLINYYQASCISIYHQ